MHRGKAAPLSRRRDESSPAPASPAARGSSSCGLRPARFLGRVHATRCTGTNLVTSVPLRFLVMHEIGRAPSNQLPGHQSVAGQTKPCMPLSCRVAYSPFYPHVTCSPHHCPAKTSMQQWGLGSPFLPTKTGISQPGKKCHFFSSNRLVKSNHALLKSRCSMRQEIPFTV